jgi:hypothetical protein
MSAAACAKVLTDGGRFASAAELLANEYGQNHPVYGPAMYLAGIVRADVAALIHAESDNAVPVEREEELRAWSELDCHRAAALEEWATERNANDGVLRRRLLSWAHEHRLFFTGLFGGEYKGPYKIDVIGGIEKQGS